ncbi:MAG: hypothetical protein IPI67_33075 [Myxococcales bacterium]|nr:hypothetical protein [Myxococcales bacterium]
MVDAKLASGSVMRRLVLCLLLVACSSESTDQDAAAPLVSGLHLGGVSLNQSVQIPLMVAGEAVASAIPIVGGRRALLRLAVEPEASWEPREVVARLELGDGPAIETRLFLQGPSTDADLSSSLNFELDGSQLEADTTFAVSLRESDGKSRGAPSAGARYPSAGQAALDIKSSSSALHVVLMPIRYSADGSNRLPELSADQVASYQRRLQALYPASSVDIRLREPVTHGSAVTADGNGWGEALQLVLSRRNQDLNEGTALANEYYFGLVNPADDFAAYCAAGAAVCVRGLSSPPPSAGDDFARGAVGLGFPGDASVETCAHELGHTHGLLHAPCAPLGFIDNVDPNFPHADGRIGAWGYDFESQTLVDPGGTVRDFMGYCEPTWVSDYTYRLLFTRMAQVNQSATAGGGGGGEKRFMVAVDAAGSLKLGPKVLVRTPFPAEGRSVEVLGDGSVVRRRVAARFLPFSHLPGGFLLISEPEPGDRAVRFGGASFSWGIEGKPLPLH